ncbi:DinB family protein [Paraflavitalea soli]|uniref:DinB family protein n=2 Tax=Paraflavitalea soli TaxID=2315862 RepID=A0A3B7MSP1_9BACT|nr:DinB family protein [Paraflavitalea soli]
MACFLSLVTLAKTDPMNKEIQYIITTLQESLDGEPWYGRSMYSLLDEVDPSSVFVNPDETGHALIELLYHMIAWAQFIQSTLEEDPEKGIAYYEALDWRDIDPTIHTWKNGVMEIKATHKRIIELLKSKNDDFLATPVSKRKYNVGYMLHGLIQHNIYHLGQIAYVKKLLE